MQSQTTSEGKQREMAEWSNAAVLKTVDCNRSGGSNPSLSAERLQITDLQPFFMSISYILRLKSLFLGGIYKEFIEIVKIFIKSRTISGMGVQNNAQTMVKNLVLFDIFR